MPYKVNLFRGEPSRIDEIMAGPWRDIRVEHIGQRPVTFASDVSEFAGFVIDGSCTLARESEEDIPLVAGSAFALPYGGTISLVASDGVARVLIVEMALGRRDEH